jgi:hypothetical protein
MLYCSYSLISGVFHLVSFLHSGLQTEIYNAFWYVPLVCFVSQLYHPGIFCLVIFLCRFAFPWSKYIPQKYWGSYSCESTWVFWDMTSCSLAVRYHCFGRTCCLHVSFFLRVSYMLSMVYSSYCWIQNVTDMHKFMERLERYPVDLDIWFAQFWTPLLDLC